MTSQVKNRFFSIFSPRWSYNFRWLTLSIAVGVVSGIGAIVFDELLHLILKHTITFYTGYVEPLRGAPAGKLTLNKQKLITMLIFYLDFQ